MEFTLYMDESGDHGLDRIDPGFPVFVLCGVLFYEDGYQKMRDHLNQIKIKFWGTKEVIFHSRDIRKCQKEFQILLDLNIKAAFYTELNACISAHPFKIIAAAIDKTKYIQRYGRIADDPYEISLSFIIERTIFLLDDFKHKSKSIRIIIEKRGEKEDKKLASYFEKVKARGTGFIGRERIQEYDLKIEFRDKKDNINGLQVADLIPYPIATHTMHPTRANPAFDLLQPKFYQKQGKIFGLKRFP
ncbi:DUF3800 domain-containing protein [Dyadobacter sp.]|uniref:DUF3800 domain-containing protein n=1 Tax=Dyadobacter sp. TaxID=1914288 RepID=UPI003F703A35